MKPFAGVVFLKHWIVNLLLLTSACANAQNIPVGTWRTHFSYNQALTLEASASKVFCAATNGLFSVDLSDNSIRLLSKIDGLSDVGVSSMSFQPSRNLLVIGYRSGLIDFVFEDRIETINEIFSSNLEGDKEIRDIAFSANETFLATDLGIIVVDTDDVRIRENYVQIGENGAEVAVKEIEVLNDLLFAKTDALVQSGAFASNLLDFNNWIRYPGTESFMDLSVANDSIYALDSTRTYRFQTNDWVNTSSELPANASRLFVTNGDLNTASASSIYRYMDGQFQAEASINASLVNDLLWVGNEYWIADDTLGLISQESFSFSPVGPLADQFSRVKVLSGTTYGFHAPLAQVYDGSQKVVGYSSFTNDRWEVSEIDGFRNVADVAFLGSDRFFGSIGDGLYDESANQIIVDLPNSSLDLDTIITAISSNASLWVSSYNTFQPIHQFDGNSWQPFSTGLTVFNRFTDIALSQAGILWLWGVDDGIVNLDPGENRSQLLTGTNGLPGVIEDVSLSVSDNAWVATDEGPATFPDASFVFDFNEAIIPTFENQNLFEGEPISAILTDGGDRVWFGTNRGLWLFNESITEQIALFNFENSPLPSDIILELAYNGETGEVFVLTDKGLVSYRSASSVGSSTHQNVTVFPNPVRPEFQGLVGIDGLANNVSVKVTDVNGVLVKELEANGGSTAWDLRNNANSRVSTGIYLLFSSTADGEETYVGKIAVIR